MGESLVDQGYSTGYHPHVPGVYVKAPVFSFSKLHGVDIALGPEMKSTGEAIGKDRNLEKALYKAILASGMKMSEAERVLFTIGDRDKAEALELARSFADIGFEILATAGTHKMLQENGVRSLPVGKIGEEGTTVLDAIRKRQVGFVINTFTATKKDNVTDGFFIRRTSVENNIPCFTSLDTAKAVYHVLESMSFALDAIEA